jgi:hypothetical protein
MMKFYSEVWRAFPDVVFGFEHIMLPICSR